MASVKYHVGGAGGLAAVDAMPASGFLKGIFPTFFIKRDLAQEDWDRPRFYAAFIKRITLKRDKRFRFDGTVMRIDSSSWPLLMQSAKSLDVILFPHLCSIDLEFYADVGLLLGFLEPLIGSKLSSLTAYPRTLDELRTIRTVVSTKGTDLRSFRFDTHALEWGRFDRKSIVQAISDTIRSCHHLVTAELDMVELEQHAFQHLSQLKHLQKLILSVYSWRGQENLLSIPQFCGGFQELRYLELDVAKLQHGLDIVKTMHSASLCSVDIQISNLEVVSAYNLLFTLFAKSPSACSLTHISFRQTSDGRPIPLIAGSMSDAIASALDFLNLEEFIFHLKCPIAVDDVVLFRMAWSWRNIRVLDIAQYNAHEVISQCMELCKATMSVLATFAQYCPNIKKFTITCLDTSNIPADPSTIVPGIEEIMVRNKVDVIINVEYLLPLADPDAVSHFLSSILVAFVSHPENNDLRLEFLLGKFVQHVKYCNTHVFNCLPRSPSNMISEYLLQTVIDRIRWLH